MARHDRNLGGCVPAALLTAPSYFFSLVSALASFLATRLSFEKKPAMLSLGGRRLDNQAPSGQLGPVKTFLVRSQPVSQVNPAARTQACVSWQHSGVLLT
jgi:hypothetical protein